MKAQGLGMQIGKEHDWPKGPESLSAASNGHALSDVGKAAFSHMAGQKFSLFNGLLLSLKDHT